VLLPSLLPFLLQQGPDTITQGPDVIDNQLVLPVVVECCDGRTEEGRE